MYYSYLTRLAYFYVVVAAAADYYYDAMKKKKMVEEDYIPPRPQSIHSQMRHTWVWVARLVVLPVDSHLLLQYH
jgi:hypothetical protein